MKDKTCFITILALVAALLFQRAPAVAGSEGDRAKMEQRIQRQLKAEEAEKGISHRTATELYREYNANEVAADAKYKNKWVQVRGRVASVAKDMAGTPYIAFAADSYGVGQVHAALFEVQIKDMAGPKNFSTCSSLEKAAGLKQGQKAMVECLGTGAILGIPRLGQCLVMPETGK